MNKKDWRNKDYEIGSSRFVISLVLIGVIVFLGLIILFSTIYTISAGHRGVLLTFGKADPNAIGEGLHFKVPFAQSVKKIEVRTQKLEAVASSASKDLQIVTTTIALNYHVIPDEASTLYTNIGLAYRERIIEPAIQESVKAATAKFTAEELIAKRNEVKTEIRDFLRERLAQNYVAVDDFNIVNFEFSQQFDAAIEAKQVAEQDALRAQRELERIKIEAEQKVTQAQAEAEAIRLQAEQIKKNRDILELRAIEKWDGVLPIYNGGGALPFIDITNEKDKTEEEV